MIRLCLAASLAAVVTSPAFAQVSASSGITVEVLRPADATHLAMPPVTAPWGKVFRYNHGIGSAAFRHPTDPAHVVWMVGDRGPNMTCAQAETLIGPEMKEPCSKVRAGRVYPMPDYTPSIYRVELDRAAGTFRVVETIPVRTRGGRPITGLLNPQTKATRDTGLDLAGNVLPYSPDNLDIEGLVRLADGHFWIGEEMGPSIALLSPDGRILRRHVPADQAEDYKDADTEIVANLPAILSKRTGNRGIESMAISPDERFLYFIMQNPLANPNAAAYNAAKNTRLFKMERATGQLVGQWVYQLDDPQSFGLDPSNRQSDPRISELTALGLDRLLVLERTEGTTKLHEIVLEGATNILGSRWDDPATTPTLEQTNDLGPTGIVPLRKTLRFDTARDMRDAPTKLEGVAFLPDGAMVLVNDNDFGIAGEETRIVIVRGAVTADPAVYRR